MKYKKLFVLFFIIDIFCLIISIVSLLYARNVEFKLKVLEYKERILEYRNPDEVIKEIEKETEKIIYAEDVSSFVLRYENNTEEIIQELDQLKLEYKSLKDKFSHINVSYFTFDQLCKIPDKYTVDDLRYLSTTVFGECGLVTGDVAVTFYDGYAAKEVEYLDASLMQKLTAQVLLNRTLYDDRFPDTIYENVIKPGQYTRTYTYESTTLDYYSKYPDCWNIVVENCLLCMNEEFDLPHNVIFQSNYDNLGKSYYAKIYVSYLRSTSYYAYG